MHIAVQCKSCAYKWTLSDEPRALHPLICPHCDAQALTRATGDLSSAVEDAMAQLWHVSQAFDLRIELTTGGLPAAFKPPEKTT